MSARYARPGRGDRIRLNKRADTLAGSTGVVESMTLGEPLPKNDRFMIRVDGHGGLLETSGDELELVARAKVPPIVCRPWCTDGDGHGDEFHVDDQRCESERRHVPHTLEPKWESGDDEWHPHELDVWVEAGPTTPDRVVVYCTGCDFQVFLRQIEADALAAILQRFADVNLDAGRPIET